ncbi:MAG: Asp-tRNA(Asn)/Glu-tRNA(Gln) amidotransferase subunit GatA [Candidatus Pacearchaeota archaeon]
MVEKIEKIKIVEKVESYLKAIEKDNKRGKNINAILQINPNLLDEARFIEEKIKKGTAGKLAGKVIAVKANINVKGLVASCASKVLQDYISPYDASVIEKIKAEDGLIIGMTNMDEFACGSSGETSAFGFTRNPLALERIPGGSSSGSAAAVAAGFCDLALGSDTGGSIRNPASHCGIVGIKPSYGLVSRYGLIDLSMSLDQIGCFAKSIDDALLLLNIIKGKDERDATTYESKEIKINKLGEIKIAVPEVKADKNILAIVEKRLKEVSEREKWSVEKIKLRYIDLAIQTYYPICYVEFFSATRKFDGRRFGKRIEEYCGEEVLRRIIGGSEISKAEFRGRYYRQALKVRELIKQEFNKVFTSFDAIIMPTVPKLPHKLGEKLSVEDMYAYDTLTVLANLAELPALSLPVGKINGIPVGLQIMTKQFAESTLFSIAKEIEIKEIGKS